MGVWNQWNGMVEWTTGMEYWNGLGQDLCTCTKSIVSTTTPSTSKCNDLARCNH